MAESELSDIVRRVVSSLRNLPNDGTRSSSSSISSSSISSSSISSSSSSSRPEHDLVEHELGQRFRLPRVSDDASTSTWPLPRGGRGRFVPYTTKAKNKKVKSKRKSTLELVIKNVCLLPSPDWNQVPRRQVKEDLVRRDLFADAWTLDISWSEEEFRAELFNLFKDQLSNPTS